MAANGYDNSHRAFLQSFMARSTMTLDEAKPILAGIFSIHDGRETLQEDITQTDLNNYIAAINMNISPFDLEIRSTLHQSSHSRVYALINTTSDPLMQLATVYSADEIAYVKRLLDAMFEENNTRRQELMAVSSIQAIQLARPPNNNNNRRQSQSQSQSGALTMKDAEEMLARLGDEGWLEKSRKGYYSLTPRALMELRGWLVESYNDMDDEDNEDRTNVRNDKIKMCFACKDIITVGQRCPTRQCPGRLHDNCTRKIFRLQRAEVCPVCKVDWTGENFVGERAIASQASQVRSRQSIRAPTPSSDGETEEEG